MSQRLDTAHVECAKAPILSPRPINNSVPLNVQRSQQQHYAICMRNNSKAVDVTNRDKTGSSPVGTACPLDWSIIHQLRTHIVSMPLFQYVNGNNIIIERRIGSALIPCR